MRVFLSNFLNPLSAKKAQRQSDPARMEVFARFARDSFVFIPEQVQRQLLDDADHVQAAIRSASMGHKQFHYSCLFFYLHRLLSLTCDCR
jgi:hypothetical protein